MRFAKGDAMNFLFGRNFILGVLLLGFMTAFAPARSEALTVVSQEDVGEVTVMQVSGDFNAYLPDGTFNKAARKAVAQEFFKTHGYDYDFLVIFSNFDYQMLDPNTAAFYTQVKNDVQGIGMPLINETAAYGSAGRLQGTVDMGNVAKLPVDPLDPDFEKTLLTLTHETMHRWGAWVNFKDADGVVRPDLLGPDVMHWSFYLDSGGSSLYGNNWRDNGDGTFTSVDPESGLDGTGRGRLFSPLDLYLMGIIGKSEVPPMLLIENPVILEDPHPELTPKYLPQLGVTVRGTPTYVTIDQIIAAEGPRIPLVADAQKNFRTAFVYLTNDGVIDYYQLQGIDALRGEWVTRFSILTDGGGMMTTAPPVEETVPANPGIIPPDTTPRTSDPDINAGVAWLMEAQQAGGFWQDRNETAERDTAAAVLALENFVGASMSYQSGKTWLAAAPTHNTDYLARKIESLVDSGQALTELLARQNPDGGWGSEAGYLSNPVDTALALKALSTVGYSSGQVVADAIAYLKSARNSDGGWSVVTGPSILQPTAHVLTAFNAYRSSYPLETEIAEGTSWVLGKQNADGGFGNSPSTVYDTSAAVAALVQLGGQRTATDEGFNYLLTTQAEDGSWNESAFQTGMAIATLWKGQLQTDLEVTSADISFVPFSSDIVPVEVTIKVNVRNLGATGAAAVPVALYQGDPATGALIGEQTLVVPGNGNAVGNFVTTLQTQGSHPFYAVVDPDNLIPESRESNNAAQKTFNIDVPPPTVGFDLESSSALESDGSVTLSVSLDHPWTESVTVNYQVGGASTATSFSDFHLPAGILTFNPEETVKSIQLNVIDDALAERDETVAVELSNPVNAGLGLAQHTVTIIDDEVPEVQITSPSPGVTGQSAPQLLYSVSRDSVVVKVDGQVVSKVSGDYLDPLEDGTHTVRVETTNSVGLTGFSEVSFTVDTAVPTVTILSPPSGLIQEKTPLLQYQVDAEAMVVVKVDGSVISKVSGDRLDPLAEGQHTLRVEATNNLGRTGYDEVVFTVNTTPLTVNILSPVAGIGRATTPLLQYQVSAEATVVVMVDGQTVGKVSGDSLGPFAPGEHVVRVEGTDALGRIGFDEVTFVVSTGTEPPYELAWSRDAQGGRNSDMNIAVDRFGNVVVASAIYEGSQNIYVAKYDNAGNFLWSKTMGTDSFEYVNGVAVDSEGSIYVGLYTWGALDGITPSGYQDGYLVKFDQDGNKQWTRKIATTASDYVYGVAVDAQDNIYVSGITGGSMGLGGGWGWNVFLTQYDKNGGRAWTRQLSTGTAGSVDNCFVAVDGSGGIYVAGNTPGSFRLTHTQIGSDDYFLAKYNSQGYLQWSRQSGTTTREWVRGLAADAQGGVYILGSTDGAFSGYTNAGSFDSFLVKYGAGGTLERVQQWGSAGNDDPLAIAAESNGNLFITERTATLTKFDHLGGLLWSQPMAEMNNFASESLALDGKGHLFAVFDDWKYFLQKYRDPRLPSVSINPDSLTNQTSVALGGTVEPGALLVVSTDTSATVGEIRYPSSGSWECTLDSLVEGKNRVTAQAKNAGGFTEFASCVVVLDTVAPSVDIISPVEGQTYSSKPALEYGVSDGTVRIFLNDLEIRDTGYPIEGLNAGKNTLKVQATDAAGNTGFDEVTFFAEGAAVAERPYEPEWIKQFGSGLEEGAGAFTKDAEGNLYVAGHSFGSENGQPNNGLADIVVSKFDQSGNNLWTWQFGTADSEYVKGIAVDDLGNVYLTWEIHYAALKGKSTNYTDIAVAKYNSSGTQQWMRTFGSTERDYVGGITLDPFGNIFVSGSTEGSINRNAFRDISDAFLAKYDNDGNEIFIVQTGQQGKDTAYGLVSDSDGNIYVTGQGIISGYVHANSPYVRKYSNSGTILWSRLINSITSFTATGKAVNLDPEGNIFIVGEIDYNDGFGSEIFVSKYNVNASQQQWFHAFGSELNDFAASIDLDASGKIFVAGSTGGAMGNNISSGGSDIFVAKFSPTGPPQAWVQQIGTTADEKAVGIEVGSEGNVFIGGESGGVLGDYPLGASDLFVMKLAAPTGPNITLSQVFSPINLTSQTVGGTMEAGSAVAVTVDTLATIGPVTYPSTTTWTCTLSNLAEGANTVTAVAIDGAGNSDSATAVVVVDTVAPTVSLTSPVTGVTGDATPLLSYSVSEGTVEVLVDSVAVNTASGSELGPVADGAHTVKVVATDAAGNVGSAEVTFTVDTTAPVVGIDPVESPSAQTSQVVSGTMEEGAAVTVTVDTAATVGAVTYPTATTWMVTISALVEGDNTITATTADAAGNASSVSAVITVDTIAPAVAIDAAQTPTNSSSQVVSGTMEAGSTVAVSVDTAATVGTVTYPTATTWSLTISGLIEGDNAITATARDAVGNASSASAVIQLDSTAPAVTLDPVTSPTNSSTQVVTGTMEEGATVAVTVDTATMVGAVTYPSSTTWSCNLSALAEGDNTVMVTATDAAGNSDSITGLIVVDTAVPAIAIDAVVSPTNNASQVLTGSMEVGSTVTVTVDTSATVGPVTYPSSTSWSCTLSGLIDGATTITATATDGTGNSGSATATIEFDTVVPTVSLSLPVSGVTGDASPLLSYSVSEGTAEVLLDGTAVNIASGSELSPLADGAHTVKIIATDAAGNVGSAEVTFTVDTAAPAVGIDPVESPSARSSQVVTGTMEEGAAVAVTVGTAATVGTVSYPSATTWSCTISGLAEGANTITATATDAVGNTSSASTVIQLDTTAPAVTLEPVTSPANSSTQVVTGTMEEGATVTVSIDTSATVGAVSYPSSTMWSATISNLAEGDNTITATASDAVGNAGSVSVVILLDTTAPVITLEPLASPTNSNTQVVIGTMEEGATVVVTVDTAAMVGAVTYPSSTTWSCILSALAEGDNTVTVTATDAAGNSGSVTGLIVVDKAVPAIAIDRVVSPTNETHQILNGTMEAGSMVAVSVDTSAIVGPVTYPSSTSWSCTLNGLVDGTNTVIVTATDGTGNSGSATATIEVDTVVPTVSLSSPIAGVTGDVTPLLSYSVSEGTVEVLLDSVAVNIASGSELGPVADGTHTVKVVATDAAGNVGSAEVTFTVDTTAPMVGIDPVESPSAQTSQVVSGTMEEGSAVTVTVDTAATVGAVTYPSTTTWSVTVDGLVEGANTITATTTDAAGNASTVSATITVDTIAPAVAIDAVQTPTNSSSQVLSGTMEAGAAVSVSVDTAETIGVVSYPTSTTWSCTLSGLVEGENTVTATATGAVGNAGSVSAVILLDTTAPAITFDAVASPTNSSSQVLTGTMEEGASVVISIDTTATVGAVSHPSSTTWSCTLSGLVEGENTFTAAATDAAGNTGSATALIVVNTSVPVMTIDPVASPTNETSQALSGTMEAGAAVVVTVDTSATVGPVTYPSATTWSCTLTNLAEGANTVTAVTTDGAGNSGSATAVIEMDTVAPAVSLSSPINGVTNDATPILSYTVSDGTVEIKVDGIVATIAPGAELGPFTDGDHVVKVTAADAAGNVGSAEVTFTIDTVAPAVSIDPADTPTNEIDQVVTGTRESGATITVTVDTTATVGPVTYPTATTWSSSLTALVEGANTVTATATDAAGNNAGSFTVVEVDTGAPEVSISSPAPGLTNDATPVLSYTISEGIAEVKVDGAVVSSASGTELGYLADGDHVVTVMAIDAAGNIGLAQVTFAVDTVVPMVTFDSIETPTTAGSQILTGTMETGTTVIVSVDTAAVPGVVNYPTAASWSCEVSALTEGENVVTVTATDTAGNSSSATTTIFYTSPPKMTAMLSPAALAADFKGTVKLVIGYLEATGGPVVVEQVVDANQNLTADAGEPVISTFRLTDGVSSNNPNIQGDEDGLANETITTTLDYFNTLDVFHAPGAFVFRIKGAASVAEAFLIVHPVSEAQTISGYVSDGSSPISGAVVKLMDKWSRTIGFASTDTSGHYVVHVAKPGEYSLIPLAEGFVADKAAMSWITLGSNGNLIGQDLIMTAGTYQVIGEVQDADTGAGIDGIWIQAENDRYIGSALSDDMGSYNMRLPVGEYTFDIRKDIGQLPANKGYLHYDTQPIRVNISDNTSGVLHALPKAEVLACGRVMDETGIGLPGMIVQGALSLSATPVGLKALAMTGEGGNYCLGLSAGNGWNIFLEEDSSQLLGYVGTKITEAVITESTAGFDLTAHPINAWIEGGVRKSTGEPLQDVKVSVQNGTAFSAGGKTIKDGTYRLGVFADAWSVDADTEAHGYASVLEQTATLVEGHTTTIDFVVDTTSVSVTVNPVESPTMVASQTISGSRTEGARVAVTVDTEATVGVIFYPTPTTWECTVYGLAEGENNFMISASDFDGSESLAYATIMFNRLNTIDITRAEYHQKKMIFTVRAVSAYGAEANLEVIGYGPMTWNERHSYWELELLDAESAPPTVIVIGTEGSQTAEVKFKPPIHSTK